MNTFYVLKIKVNKLKFSNDESIYLTYVRYLNHGIFIKSININELENGHFLLLQGIVFKFI